MKYHFYDVEQKKHHNFRPALDPVQLKRFVKFYNKDINVNINLN